MSKSISRKKIVSKNSSGTGGGGGGGESLAQTLAIGNETGANDIVLSPRTGQYSQYLKDTLYSKLCTYNDGVDQGFIFISGFFEETLFTAFLNQLTVLKPFVATDTAALFGEVIIGNPNGGQPASIRMQHNTNLSYIDIKVPSAAISGGFYTLFLPTAQGVPNSLLMNDGSGNLSFNELVQDSGEQTYSGTITWDGTAPTTLTNATYRWSRVGKCVTMRIMLKYTNAGVTNTQCVVTLPSGAPTPQDPSGFNNANDFGHMAAGNIGTGAGNMAGGNTRCALGPNATATGYIITTIASTSVNAKVLRITLDYYIP